MLVQGGIFQRKMKILIPQTPSGPTSAKAPAETYFVISAITYKALELMKFVRVKNVYRGMNLLWRRTGVSHTKYYVPTY